MALLVDKNLNPPAITRSCASIIQMTVVNVKVQCQFRYLSGFLYDIKIELITILWTCKI